ncbi:MAG: tetratricopeptide repeat-containing protein [Caldimonas sp.]
MNERAFVIRGFDKKKDKDGQVIDFEQVHAALIAPALVRCGLAGSTTVEVIDPGNIRADMFALILQADIVICDITVHNANVFYELGVRHALRKKHTVLIKGDPSADTTPFDLSTDRYLKYSLADPGSGLEALVRTVQAALLSTRDTDSPIFLMMPTLREADPSEVTALPLDLIEEVKRAEAASDKALLRVIAEDLQGQRYQWDGLRRVARSLWSLKDWTGALAAWETLHNAVDGDIEANLALANLYERDYRNTRREARLEASNQAIRRVLDAPRSSSAERAEALALQGRNLKTMWRARLVGTTDPAAVRQLALDARALESYESYRGAFDFDLNAFYPGLAALQMGHILGLLSALPGWRNLFKGNRTLADRARADLESELPALAHVVAASITRARKQLPEDERVWADIADADLLFLTVADEELQTDHSLIVQAYRDAIPPNKHFAWDATSGQLELFSHLGHRAEAVRSVMQAFENTHATVDKQREHLVVFSGHGIDADGAKPRFPAVAETKARALISERLDKLRRQLPDGDQLTVLASAAPGADILLHEVCAELGLHSRLCLPMPSEHVASQSFAAADGWRARFLQVVRVHETTLLQMLDDKWLPRWLHGRGIDPWERGNRWVMQLAQTWGASRVTLLALWDGQDDGRSGGTAQMVRLARAFGKFETEIIDSRQLLA